MAYKCITWTLNGQETPLSYGFQDSNCWRRTDNDFYLFSSFSWISSCYRAAEACTASGIFLLAAEAITAGHPCWKWHGIRQQPAPEPILTIGYTCRNQAAVRNMPTSHRSSASLSPLTAALLINITLFYNSSLRLATSNSFPTS
jgi:hypothetical protein